MNTFVAGHFRDFLRELELPEASKADAAAKANRVARSLFSYYYPGQAFDPDCYAIVGSHGKGLATRPPTDIDVLFQVPGSEFDRIEQRVGNKQSALLQEVRAVLLGTFPRTAISADGQIIELPLEGCTVEVVPSFRYVSGLNCGKWLTPNTGDGGSWRFTDPVSEARWLAAVDAISGGKASHLVRILKAWKRACDVPIKSVCLEIAATVFISQWDGRAVPGLSCHHLMVSNFFSFLTRYCNGWARPAGIDEWIPLGSEWRSKCESARRHAQEGCDLEFLDCAGPATRKWRAIFGSQFTFDNRFDVPSAFSVLAGQNVS